MTTGIPIDGRILRRLREDQMWGVSQLAREAQKYAKNSGECSGVSRQAVRRFEAARLDASSTSRYPSPDNLRYLVGALCPCMAAVEELVGGSPPRRLLGLCSDAPPGLKAAEDVNRRQLTKAALAVTGMSGAAVVVDGGLDLSSIGRRRGVDGALVDELEAETAAQQAGYPRGASSSWTARAQSHLDGLTDLLGASMAPGQRQRLLALVGTQSIMLGASLRNDGQWGKAVRLTAGGVAFAREAGNPSVHARALGGMAQLYETVDEARRSAYAGAADRAARTAGVPMGAKSRSWLYVEHALGRATAADGEGFRAAIHHAEQTLEAQSPTDDLHGRYFGEWGPVQLAIHRGLGHVLLEEPEAARGVLEPVLAEHHGAVSAVKANAALGEALALTGEPEAAAQRLEQALHASADLGYGRGVRFVRSAATRMGEWAHEPFMAPLVQKLQLLGG